MTANQPLLPIRTVQHMLGDVCRGTVYNLVKRGELTKVNVGARGLITAQSVESYIERIGGSV